MKSLVYSPNVIPDMKMILEEQCMVAKNFVTAATKYGRTLVNPIIVPLKINVVN